MTPFMKMTCIKFLKLTRVHEKNLTDFCFTFHPLYSLRLPIFTISAFFLCMSFLKSLKTISEKTQSIILIIWKTSWKWYKKFAIATFYLITQPYMLMPHHLWSSHSIHQKILMTFTSCPLRFYFGSASFNIFKSEKSR